MRGSEQRPDSTSSYFPPIATSLGMVTAQAYTDANSKRSVYRITPELAYKLSDDGSTTVSIQYDRGTDKDTLVSVNQYLAKLNYKY
jgi:hypothetical protein